jgi:hypothetical protein
MRISRPPGRGSAVRVNWCKEVDKDIPLSAMIACVVFGGASYWSWLTYLNPCSGRLPIFVWFIHRHIWVSVLTRNQVTSGSFGPLVNAISVLPFVLTTLLLESSCSWLSCPNRFYSVHLEPETSCPTLIAATNLVVLLNIAASRANVNGSVVDIGMDCNHHRCGLGAIAFS